VGGQASEGYDEAEVFLESFYVIFYKLVISK